MATKQLNLVKQGEMSVDVARPIDPPLPRGFINMWTRTDEGRTRFYMGGRRPTQRVRVSYQVLEDSQQLQDLIVRARRNQSGISVRGYARADRTSVHQDLSQRVIDSLVRRAANHTSLKVIDGPATVKVKLLEQPEGSPATCMHCARTLTEHEQVEETTIGDWDRPYVRGRSYDRQWDPNKPRINTHYLCPQEASS